MIIEHIMERIATALNKDPTAVKQLNYYKNGEVGHHVNDHVS